MFPTLGPITGLCPFPDGSGRRVSASSLGTACVLRGRALPLWPSAKGAGDAYISSVEICAEWPGGLAVCGCALLASVLQSGCSWNRVIAGVQLDEYGRMIDGDAVLAGQLIGRQMVTAVGDDLPAGWTMRVIFDREPIQDHTDLSERPDDVAPIVRTRSTTFDRGYGWYFDAPVTVTVQATTVSAVAEETAPEPPAHLAAAVQDALQPYVVPDAYANSAVIVTASSLPPEQYARMAASWRRPLPREISTGLQ